MESLEEEKLVQMVDDFIESVDDHHQSPTSSSFRPLSSNSKSHHFFTLKVCVCVCMYVRIFNDHFLIIKEKND